jgi:hypothetical protein
MKREQKQVIQKDSLKKAEICNLNMNLNQQMYRIIAPDIFCEDIDNKKHKLSSMVKKTLFSFTDIQN